VTAYEQDALYKRLGENAFMQQKWNEALQFIRMHPRLEVDLFARRFVAFWAGIDSPIEHFLKAEALWDRILLLANFLVALGTAGGLAVIWIKRPRYAFLLSVAPIVFPWVYYATQPYLRYRLPIDPILMLLITAAVAAFFDRDVAGTAATKPAQQSG
jgi:hypothetical protein